MKKGNIKRVRALVAALSCAVLTASAQVIPDSAALASVMNPRMADEASGQFEVEPAERSVGVLSEDTVPQTYTFLCRNKSTQPLTVQRLSASCGCTQARISRKTLAAGDTATISVRYNPYAQAGRVFTRVFIYTSLSAERPSAALTLTGEVTPSADAWKDYRYAMGTLRVRRKSISFGKVTSGTRRTETIPCVNSGSRPLKVKAAAGFLPAYLTLRCEPAELEPGQSGELVVELDGSRLPQGDGTFRSVSRILLDGVSAPPSSRTLTVRTGEQSQVRSTVDSTP